MIVEYLQACADRHEKIARSLRLEVMLADFSDQELRALAEGRAKLAFGPCPDGWVEKFQGSPLLQQAVDLERQELEVEVERAQAEAAADAVRPDWSDFSRRRDEICVQKRLLDLAHLEAMGGGAKGPEVPVSVEAHPPMALPEPAATKAASLPTMLRTGMGAAMPALGRAAAAAQPMLQVAKPLAARALGAARPLAGQAMGWAAKNPAAAGAVVGAAGGAVAGGQGHRLRGALTGGVLGAGMAADGRALPAVSAKGPQVAARGSMPMPVNPGRGVV